MWIKRSSLLVWAGLGLVCLGCFTVPAFAQMGEDLLDEPELESAVRRRRPSMFNRAKMGSAEEQLVLARTLEAKGRDRKALRAYHALVRAWHESPEAVEAQLASADLLFNRRDYRKAFDEYQYLIDNFAGRFPYDRVIENQFTIANEVRTARRGRLLLFDGFAAPERALPMYRKVALNAPHGVRAAEAQFQVGVIEEGRKEYDAAILAYERLIFRYPRHALAELGTFRRAACLYAQALRAPRDEEHNRAALAAVFRYLSAYPEGSEVAEAQKMRTTLYERMALQSFEKAEFYDRIAKRPEAALLAYAHFMREFPQSKMAGVAKLRIEELELATGGTRDN